MRKYIIVFFSVMVVMLSCKSGPPEGVIPKPQMISLLTDMHITDGSLYAIPQIADTLYKYGHAKYGALFKKHHTNNKQFTRSLKYYSTQPDELAAMYDKVAANIQGRMDSLTKSNAKDKNAVPAQ